MKRRAHISSCGQYRYSLSRSWIEGEPPNPVVFVMLNPSTADGKQDDATIRRCVQFARDFGHNLLIVANLYALRSRHPDVLKRHPDPVGPRNNEALRTFARRHNDIVCAWGGKATHKRVKEFREIMDAEDATLWCLGTTKDGAPRHPLFMPRDSQLEEWP